MDEKRESNGINPVIIFCDIVMIIGIVLLVWNAFYTSGWAPIPPFHLFKEFDPAAFEAAGHNVSRHYLFAYALALVGIAEYPAMLVMMKRIDERVRAGLQTTSVLWQIRLFFVASPWLYIVVLYFVMTQSSPSGA